MTNWSDTPPTVAGYFWVKSRRSAQEWIAERTRHGVWDRISGEVAVAAEDGEAAELVQFGHRIPANDELAHIDRERHALCEVATLCMNTRAIMPEFREIEDYAEVPDIIGAFLERLKELPGLIEEYAEQRANLGTEDGIADAEPEMWKAMLGNRAKINAILGVAE